MSSIFRGWRDYFQDNQNAANTQSSVSLAATEQNNFFAVWLDGSTYNTAHPSIVARSFDANGNSLSNEVVLNPALDALGLPFFALDPSAVRLPLAGNDGLAVSFTNNVNGAGTNNDLYVIRTNAALGRLENFILIDGGAQITEHSSITSFADGRLAVAYTVQNSVADWDIVVRFVAPNGVVSAPVTVFDDVDRSDNVDVGTLANGNIVIVFENELAGNAGNNDIRYAILNNLGTIVVGPTFVSGGQDGANERFPHVAALDGGGFVVTWEDSAGDANGYGVRASVYDSSGSLVRGNILVNGTSPSGQTGDQRETDVTALRDGGFVVGWNDFQTNAQWSQRFDSEGDTLGAATVAIANGTFSGPELATLSDGRFVSGVNGLGEVFSAIFSADSVRTDFNGEFTSDLLWTNGANGVLGVWTMANGSISSTVALNHDMPGWNAQSGDFNGDGTADLLWNSGASTGVLGVWTMQNATISRTTPLNHDMPGWSSLAGDFNGDGTTDLLWNSGATSGVLGVWEMQNSAIASTIAMNHNMPGWSAVAGDFNGDGTTDLLWNNGAATGVLGVWEMQDSLIFRSTPLNHDMPGWTATAGDFNGDGTSDLIWNSGAGGVLGVWLMRDGAIAQTIAVNHDMPGWSLAATGDFNRDGTTDLLWSNANGALGVWLMDDGAIGQTIAVNHDMPGWTVIG